MLATSARGSYLPASNASPEDWLDRPLGQCTVSWDDRDVILFAAAVGARSSQLDLVYERDLRVLPTFALPLTQWVPDVLRLNGAIDTTTALHVAQRLDVVQPLAVAGSLTMSAWVSAVWDKGTAALYEVTVESDAFVTTWSLLAPERGGFAGDRGPRRPARATEHPLATGNFPTAENAAVLYRLLSDRHPVHIDPAVAAAIGQPGPILHGLATLATGAMGVADLVGEHPADLVHLEGRFATPVLPGEILEVRGFTGNRFEVTTARGTVIEVGVAGFATAPARGW